MNAEWAFYVSKAADLSLIQEPFAPAAHPALRQWERQVKNELAERCARLPLTRLYFGQEFCARLMPDAQEVKQARSIAQERGLGFTLVTPYVNDEQLGAVKELLDLLADDEVVVNDYGVLALLQDYPRLKPVAGRMLEKMIRDPRFAGEEYESFFTPGARDLLRSSNITAGGYRRLLSRFRVERVEFDPVPQGFDTEVGNSGFALSLYVPFGYVSTGRVCVMAALGRDEGEKFKIHLACSRQCRRYYQLMRRFYAPSLRRGNGARIELLRRGKTVFYLNHLSGRDNYGSFFQRLVYQPVVPA
ncbi:hypothetical protein [Desulfotomaculum copahuensis]|uniref:Uncharacterized protein n=1 Tax=Desulfotomaculum copahuensis TaxID=1838280 RepID=A0A1B7LFV4_9FIRM|nr:hypothetical protein [Desulfotomaculum copahuensis]OAT83607.1 hypothetical protein A6M21_07950 [Desulfotomaculum copahuensis]